MGRCPVSTATQQALPPAMEAEVACDRGTQVDFVRVRTVSDQDLPPQRPPEGSTQTLPAWTRDNVTQVPHVMTRDSVTSMPQVMTRESGTEMPRVTTVENSTQMSRVIQKHVYATDYLQDQSQSDRHLLRN